MNIIQATNSGFSKFATFSGRASRSEFWWFYVAMIVILSCYTGVLAWVMSGETLYYVSNLLALVLLIPLYAVMSRRLHDAGHSAWNLLWTLVPCIGGIVLLIYVLQGSKPANEYGPVPNN